MTISMDITNFVYMVYQQARDTLESEENWPLEMIDGDVISTIESVFDDEGLRGETLQLLAFAQERPKLMEDPLSESDQCALLERLAEDNGWLSANNVLFRQVRRYVVEEVQNWLEQHIANESRR